MSTYDANDERLLVYRVAQAEKALAKKADQEDVAVIGSKVDKLQGLIIKLMVTVSASAIVFAFSVLAYAAEKGH